MAHLRPLRDVCAVGFLALALLSSSNHFFVSKQERMSYRSWADVFESARPLAKQISKVRPNLDELGLVSLDPDPGLNELVLSFQYFLAPAHVVLSSAPKTLLLLSNDPAKLNPWLQQEHMRFIAALDRNLTLVEHENQ